MSLFLCSSINKELCKGERDPDVIMGYFLDIHEALKMLEKNDPHIN